MRLCFTFTHAHSHILTHESNVVESDAYVSRDFVVTNDHNKGVLLDIGAKNCVVGMDNCFTWARVMTTLTEMGVGVVGTACNQRGWLPKSFHNINDARFNTAYGMNNQNNCRVVRWVDDNVVTVVTNVHIGNESVKSMRRKPCPTTTNRANLNAVWGNKFVKKIKIPKVMDDYNHWMCGVNKADQLIAYCHPNPRCRRNWMPIWFHCLDVVQVNSHIVCDHLGWKSQRPNSSSKHKEHCVDFIKALIAKGKTFEMRATLQRILGYMANASPPTKRTCTSTKNPMLPDCRLLGDPRDHIRADAPTQRQCRMCSYLHAKAKNDGVTPLPKIR